MSSKINKRSKISWICKLSWISKISRICKISMISKISRIRRISKTSRISKINRICKTSKISKIVKDDQTTNKQRQGRLVRHARNFLPGTLFVDRQCPNRFAFLCFCFI